MWASIWIIVAAAAAGGAYVLVRQLREAEGAVAELQAELARRQLGARRQEMQAAITRILSEATSLEAASVPLVEAIGVRLDWSFGAIWETDPALGVLRCRAVWRANESTAAFEAETRRLTFGPGAGLPGRAWAAGTAVWLAEAALEPDSPRAVSGGRSGLHAGCAFPVVRRGRTIGVVELFSRNARDTDEETLQALTDIGHQIGQFAERKGAEQRLKLLSEASNVLGASLDYAATLASVARLVVPALADSCVIDILEEDGSIRRLTPVPSGPEGTAPVEGLTAISVDVTGTNPLARVLKSGRSELLPALTDKLLRAMVTDHRQLETVRRGGPRPAICVPLATRGRVLGAISLATLDSSHHYGPDDVALAEELARRCAVAVDNARLFREAQRASEEKTRFLAAVSHDLRTPAHAITLLSTLIRRDAESRGDAGDAFVAHCRRIEHASRAFTDLLTNLLDLASLETGQKRMQEAVFSIRDLIAETTANLGSVARAKGLTLQWQPLREELFVRADRTELGRVLINLIGNALKFTERGAVTVSAEGTADGGVALAVKDTGPGIPRDVLAHVFDEFFQARNPERDRAKGRGLGLAIAKRIMEAMGGSLLAESAVGHGAVFTAMLPADRVVGKEALPAREPGARERQLRVRPASILVIDDDAVSADALGEILRQEGFRASVATGGEEGLQRLSEDPADLVLVDMMMPGLDGIGVISRIRGLPQHTDTKIIVLTGDVARERMQAAQAAGADAFVSKPLQLEPFLETVRLTLASTREAPSPP